VAAGRLLGRTAVSSSCGNGASSIACFATHVNPTTNYFFDPVKAEATMPPGHPARVRELQTFDVPLTVSTSEADRQLGCQMIDAWRKDGILQVAFPKGLSVLQNAFQESKRYFAKQAEEKAKCVDSQSFAGYIASGEEITDGIADCSEIFTVTKDLDPADLRVQNGWPCHGPIPWPNEAHERAMTKLMQFKGALGDRILTLIALGLGLKEPWALNRLTQDGWHHLRVLRYAC
jgi:isopenicillin N synthase-like dioxygenase